MLKISRQSPRPAQNNETTGAMAERESAPQAVGKKKPLLSLRKETLRQVAGGLCLCSISDKYG